MPFGMLMLNKNTERYIINLKTLLVVWHLNDDFLPDPDESKGRIS